jgi:hypothetical protein
VHLIGWDFTVVNYKILIHPASFIAKISEYYKLTSLKSALFSIASGILLLETFSEETLSQENIDCFNPSVLQ